MTAPNPIPTDQSGDSALITNFMPNRAHTRLWRVVAVWHTATGIRLAFHPLWILFSEFHARSVWPRAQARIASAQALSAPKRPPSPTSSTSLPTK